jgi:carbon-monoxide dehydrogenase medium subunit
VKPPPFEYLRPESLPEALALIGARENSRPLAGGQSLMALLNLRLVFPEALIDLNRISELAGVELSDGKIAIGAMTRQRVLERSPLIQAQLPIMAQALRHVGHRQTRNRGTIGGSICHLDPSAELPAIALLYDAELDIASARGQRTSGMAEFMAGYLSVNLRPGEILTRISIKPWPAGHGSAFLEHSRRHGDFAIAPAACLIERAEDGGIARIALAAGGVAETPIRLTDAEAMLTGSHASDEIVARAAATIADRTIAADIHADVDYRRHVAVTLIGRAIRAAYLAARAPERAHV